MPSLTKEYIDQLSFSPLQLATIGSINKLKGKQELFYQQVPEALKSLQHHAKIESSESSNRIEGITASHKRIESLVLKKTIPKNRSEQEIAGYRDVLALVHESSKEIALSKNTILQFHSYLHRYLPQEGGFFKKSENEIVEKDEKGKILRVRFKPVSALQTPQAMEIMIENFNKRVEEGYDSLILIPLFVLDFLCIHPFSDGNGRISRLLTLLLLYQHNFSVGRYISLERIIEEAKETYYETLEECSNGWHDSRQTVSPWLNYFWGFLLRAYKEFEEKTQFLSERKGSKRDYIKDVINNWAGYFTISDLESACPSISRDMIRLVLKELRDENKIVVSGKGRASKWRKISSKTFNTL